MLTKVPRWFVVLIHLMALSLETWVQPVSALMGHAMCTNKICLAQTTQSNSSTVAVEQEPVAQTV